MRLSIIIPMYNEEQAIGPVISRLRALYPDAEVIVVDDGSKDASAARAAEAGAKVIRHPYNKGNGAAVRSGIRAAQGDIVLMMDGDGQHDPEDVARFVALFPEYDMVVGARGMASQASYHRGFANAVYNGLASYLTDFEIEDLTSGFRAFKRELILPFVELFPMGFSYPTTSTLAMLKAGYNLKYIPIQAAKRVGKSKIKLLRDGSRFFLIILKLVTLFSPMRIFMPVSTFFGTMGLAYSLMTLWEQSRFTNMGAMLLIVAIVVFLMGLLAEQLAAIYIKKGN